MTMKKENIFKAYFITRSLLEDFQKKGGFHTMLAEEILLSGVLDSFLNNTITDYNLINSIKFDFGLTKKHLDKAIKNYNKYMKEVH